MYLKYYAIQDVTLRDSLILFIFLILSFYSFFIFTCIIKIFYKFIKLIFLWIYQGFKES